MEEMHPSIGGCAANTGIGLHKLGVSTGVMGKVGRDGFGDFVRGYLQRSGVASDGVTTDERAYTSATMVMIAADGAPCAGIVEKRMRCRRSLDEALHFIALQKAHGMHGRSRRVFNQETPPQQSRVKINCVWKP